MSEPPPQPPAKARPPTKAKPRIGRGVAIGAVVLCGLGVAAVVAAYMARGPIGARLATDYLARRGVPATIAIERLELDGFVGAVRLGPAANPDLVIERLEVAFAAAPLWRRAEVPQVRAVRVVGARLRGRLRDGRLTFGSLQRLIDEVMAQPATGPMPDVRIERGTLALDAPAGPLLLTGDGVLARGRLTTASLALAPARLAGFGAAAEQAAGRLNLAARGDRLAASLHLTAAAARTGAAAAQAVDLAGSVELPYPASGFERIDGPVKLDLALQAGEAGAGGAAARRVSARLQFDGASTGPIRTMALAGVGRLDLRAASGRGGGLTATRPALNLVSERFTLSQGDGRWRAAGVVQAALTAAAARTRAGGRPLDLSAISATGSGDVTAGPGGAALTMGGEAHASGGFAPRDAAALAKALAADPALEAAAARSLRSFRIDAPALSVDVEGRDGGVQLRRPLRIAFAGGAEAVLAPRPGAAVAAVLGGTTRGAFRLSLAGGGFPSVEADVARYRAVGDAVDAEARLAAAGSISSVQDGAVALDARLVQARGRLSVTAAACGEVKAAAVRGAKGEPVLQGLAAQVCPAPGGAPLLTAAGAGWTANARVAGLAAALPAAMVRIEGGEGVVALRSAGPALTGSLDLASAGVIDTGSPVRFRPLTTRGRVDLADRVATGDLVVSLAAGGAELARVKLVQDLAAGDGSAAFETAGLQFAPDGLQPASIAPIAAQWLTEVRGVVAASGRIAWSEGGLQSSGRVSFANLDARTSAGPVKGAAADIALTSLAPLTTAPNQRVAAARLEALVPVTDLTALVSLSDKGLAVSDASATVARGRASLDPLVIGADPAAPLQGVLRMKGIDLGDLIAAFNLSDAMAVDARIDGALPFSVSAAGLRFSGGKLFAAGPGRLSIRREALQGTVAGGAATATVETAPGAPVPAAPAVQQNAVQDFAYQALENLAFDSLDAAVDSRPEGRLGMVFHLKGRHDPPKAETAKIPVTDLLRGTAFDKPIPLPKGTGVNLTLDTSLNFDQLLADYRGLNARDGAK